ncbi:HNH endonuclease [Mesomycoplasma moatsii]|uniref:HNH endonuclease n=1 Tax=Mesomycoplasma moatsii TaxID=171287 RepID=UPI0004186F8E
MAICKYREKTERIWEQANYCFCGFEDCNPNNHRLCGICGAKILYGSHESVQSQNNSRYSWNVDHIIPRSKGGTNKLNNLQAVHIRCNRSKGDKSGEYRF